MMNDWENTSGTGAAKEGRTPDSWADPVGEMAEALTRCGLHPAVKDCGPFTELSVTAPRTVFFLVVNGFAHGREEAVRRSELISERLTELRAHSQAMVIAPDLWLTRKEMMLPRMLAHCGIFSRVFARNCEVGRIERPVAATFLNANHSYGTAVSRHCYGLFTLRQATPGALVAVAEFSNALNINDGSRKIRSYEWIRYASLPDVRVEGGMGKVMRRFISDIHPDVIMSYADLEWSTGEVYSLLGFERFSVRTPVLFAVDPATMRRIPIEGSRKAASGEDFPENGVNLFYRNFGSLRYRLRIG